MWISLNWAKNDLLLGHDGVMVKFAKLNVTASDYVRYPRRVKKSPSKIENSLSGMMSEGFEKIQTKSAERVRSKLNKVNR